MDEPTPPTREPTVGDLIDALADAIATAEEHWRADADQQGIVSGGKRACLIAAAVLETLAAQRLPGAPPLTNDDLLVVAQYCQLHQDYEIVDLKARIEREVAPSTQDTP